jgi:hypothetical protein
MKNLVNIAIKTNKSIPYSFLAAKIKEKQISNIYILSDSYNNLERINRDILR